MMSNFWHIPLIQFSKFNNFLWLCWFLGKNLCNFVPPAWKLDNPYCHTVYDVRLIVSYRSYNLNVILVRILDEIYISSPFLDPHGSAKILCFGSKSSMLRVVFLVLTVRSPSIRICGDPDRKEVTTMPYWHFCSLIQKPWSFSTTFLNPPGSVDAWPRQCVS